MKIRCVDPDSHDYEGGARIIAATGQAVPYRHQVEVPDELAGRVPTGKPGDEDYDPGEGLLAQTDVWRPVGSKDTDKESE